MGTTHYLSKIQPKDSSQQYGFRFYPVNLFNLNVAGTEDASLAFTAAAESTTDNGVMTNQNSTAMYGCLIAQGDVISTNFDILPDDMDIASASNMAVVYSADGGTTTRLHTFTGLYHTYPWGDAAADAVTTPATALDTIITIADAENDTAQTVQVTAYGIINASSFAAAGDGVQWSVTATTISTSAVTVYGMLFRYIRRYV